MLNGHLGHAGNFRAYLLTSYDLYTVNVVAIVNLRMSDEEIADLDALVGPDRYPTRSEAIRDAVARLVQVIREDVIVESHRRAYAEVDGDDEAVLRRSRQAVRHMIETDS